MRGLLAAWIAVLVAASGYLGVRIWNRVEHEDAAPLAPDERLSPRGRQYVVDDRVGWRPRANLTVKGPIASIDGSERRTFERHLDNWGLVEREDFDGPPPKPAVLLLGDSHVMGIVSNEENATELLQQSLRAEPGLATATVLNAASGYYSLYQYTLRARELVDRVEPALIVVVVFVGNDFHDLEDTSRPHLDDQLAESPAGSPSPGSIAATVARQLRLGIPKQARELFDQGLNQASYFQDAPERFPVVVDKALRAAELLEAVAAEHGARCLFVLLPSYDMVYPAETRVLGPEVAALVDADWNTRIQDAFLAGLGRLGIDAMTVLPEFVGQREQALYAGDYHIWREGHAVLAAAMRDRAAALLATPSSAAAYDASP
jgi:hypothetical protein